jgi:acyl transferase domain-containing protein/acyl-CoA synthetase (AMP-forming)/AMP-acid ligase II/acyl carrier protein
LPIGDGEDGERLSYGDLDRQARALATRLGALGLAGERALLLYPSGLEFIGAFLGCLYAGVVAVPVSMGRRNRPGSRLRAIAADARARVVLTTAALLPDSQSWPGQVPELEGLIRLSTDDVPGALADDWRDPRLGFDDLAFLQYTSGSTATPKGVMVTHGNLVGNSELIRRCFGTVPDGEGVTWLPFHHDMGLIGGLLQALYCGASCTLLAPAAFLQRPLRWIEAVSRTGALVSGGPNFAYDLCADKATPERIAGLDLSKWRVAFNGAEPVRADTIERFARGFAPCGFRREAFLPCYGMAETTLMVSGGPWAAPPVVCTVRAAALEQGRIELAESGETNSRELVGCGQVPEGIRVAIADPEAGARTARDGVGEIWVAGASVANGYWDKPDESEQTFRAKLSDTGEGPFLRTGDLGFVRDNELFITGRIKDLIIVRGRNVYPQDVEYVAGRSHPALRPEACASFAIEISGQERLVVVLELERFGSNVPVEPIARAVRDTLAEQLELDVYAVVLIRMLTLPRTSSGKVQRHVCRARFLDGGLDEVGRSVVAPADDAPAAPLVPVSEGPAIPRTAPEIRDWLVTRLAPILGVAPADLDIHQPLDGSGLTSLQVIGLAGELQEWLGRPTSPTLVYEYPTIAELSQYLAGGPTESSAGVHTAAHPEGEREPIAIIGIGCRFPGAEGPEAFWRLLRDGIDAVSDLPSNRSHIGEPERTLPRRGGFLSDVDRFDADFFGISPREAARADPQQRVLLEVAWEAFEDAGQVVERLAGTNVGVFVGISTRDYGMLMGDEADAALEGPGAAGFRLVGNAGSIAANRISYVFDFRGPSLAIDTACSSSLAAVHLACEALRDGEATIALAGGVNLMLAPEVTERLARAEFLSDDGRCKAFDDRADGYVRGEGAGLVVLKPLAKALADGDAIYALIRGGAVNQDGRTVGLTAPSRKAQEDVLRAAYDAANVDPASVQYVEAHGTGTLLGDPIEAKALGAVIGSGRPEDQPCLIGSVKTNVGHLEASAGVAGLIKLALALKHREVPASLHYQRPNPHIPFADLRLKVASNRSAWPVSAERARAGVSSFGFGGTNVHLVLEGVAPTHGAGGRADSTPLADACLLPLSARHPETLKAVASAFRAALSDGLPGASLREIASTAALRRDHHDYRLAVLASSSRAEAVALLDAFLAGDARVGLFAGKRSPSGPPRLAFVFPGEGSLAPDVCHEFLEREPVFRNALARCDEIFRPLAEWSLVESLDAVRLATTEPGPEVTQPLAVAVQVALVALWRSWGIEPTAVVGHGLGEISAAFVAGALELSEALRIALVRGRLLSNAVVVGKTIAVTMSLDEARLLTSLMGGRLTIAAVEGPTSLQLSGNADVIELVRGQVESRGASTRIVDSKLALQSPRMDSVASALESALAGLRHVPAQRLFVSTVTGQAMRGQDLDSTYWRRNVREPVQLVEALGTLISGGYSAFVEVAPMPILSAAISQVLDARGVKDALVTSICPRNDGHGASLEPLGALYAAGFPVAWKAVYGPGHWVRLPNYPWRRRRYWIDAATTRDAATDAAPDARLAEHSQAELIEPRDDGATLSATEPASAELVYEIQWPEKARGRDSTADASGRWLILEDARGVGRALSRLLEDRGATCTSIRVSQPGRADQSFHRAIDPADAEAIKRLLVEDRPYRGVVYLWGLDAVEPNPELATGAQASAAVDRVCAGLSNVERALSNSPGTKLWLVTRGAQPTGHDTGTPALLQGALWGVARTLAGQCAVHWGGAIDLDHGVHKDEAAALLTEITAPHGEDQVAFRQGRRRVARLARAEPPSKPATALALSPADTYVVAGGFDAFGIQAARWLVDRGARRLALVGRDLLADRRTWRDIIEGDSRREVAAALQELELQGASIFLYRANIADGAAIDGLFGVLRDEMPPIRGIVLTELASVSGTQLAQNLLPVAATWNLRRVARALPLDFFVSFSSSASFFGAEPAAAASCAFMGGFAHDTRHRGLPATSVAWGPWSGSNPATSVVADWLPRFNHFDRERALKAVDEILPNGATHALVADLDWSGVGDGGDGGRPWTLFEHFAARSESVSESRKAIAVEPCDWRSVPPEHRREWLLGFIRDKVATALEQDPSEVGTDRPLSAMGVDSMTGMEIKWAVEDGLGVTLPLASMADGPTIAQLVERALEFVESGAVAAP